MTARRVIAGAPIIARGPTLLDALPELLISGADTLTKHQQRRQRRSDSKETGLERVCRDAGRRRDLLEDLDWMIHGGETTEGAAKRLEYANPDNLWKALDRWDCLDRWEKLRRNEVARFGATLDEIKREALRQTKKGDYGRRVA